LPTLLHVDAFLRKNFFLKGIFENSWTLVQDFFIANIVEVLQRKVVMLASHTKTQLVYSQDYLGEPVPKEIFCWTLWCKGR